MIVGFFNVLVIALCIALISDPSFGVTGAGVRFQVFFLVSIVGAIPGTVTGGVLGLLVGAMTRGEQPRAFVLAILMVLSCCVVSGLGECLGARELIVVSCLPTLAACSILERWTRRKDDPAIAPAVVL